MELMLQLCTWPGRNFVAQLHLVAPSLERCLWPWEGTGAVGAVGVRQAYLMTAFLHLDRCMRKRAYWCGSLYLVHTRNGAEVLK